MRSADRLGRAERAADLARDALGSWGAALVGAALVTAGIAMAARASGSHVVAVFGAVLSGVALVQLALVLMTSRRADRTAHEVALYDLESGRRAAAAVEGLRDEMVRLRDEVARLTARVQTSGQRIDEAGPGGRDGPREGREPVTGHPGRAEVVGSDARGVG